MTTRADFTAGGRNRSHTWHGQQIGTTISETNCTMDDSYSVSSETVTSVKKPWSRRNAWGSLSYADLISKAIDSAPSKRMTLAQIYDWMVQNVPYFHDKGNTNSSAGWKNSIRHNLSLHRRFRRVSNDDTGKSSWWMLNDEGTSSAALGRRKLLNVGYHGKPATGDEYSTNGEKSSSFIRCVNSINWSNGNEVPIAELNVKSVCTTSTSEFSDKQPTAIIVTPDLTRETTFGHVSRLFPVTSLTWLPLGAEHFSLIGNAENSADPDGGPSSYPLPLMPISEIFEPIDASSSCDIQLVELQSSTLYGDYNFQTAPHQGSQSMEALDQHSFAKNSPAEWFQSSSSLAQFPIATVSSKNDMNPSDLQVGGQQQPGWSLLRQMLAQTHDENARMNGISNVSGVVEGWHWMHPNSDSSDVTCFVNQAIDVSAVSSTASSFPVQAIKEDNVSVLPKTAIVIEPFSGTENVSLFDQDYASKWDDDVKYGDSWNVNLNVVLGVHEEISNKNKNSLGTVCVTSSN